MYKKLIAFFTFALALLALANAQQPLQRSIIPVESLAKDSVVLFSDSLQTVTVDTLTPKILKLRDSVTNVLWLDSLSKGYGFAIFSLKELIHISKSKEKVVYQDGDMLPKGNVWILAVIGALLIFFSVLKSAFGKQLSAVIQSFYSNRALSNLNKEDNLVTSWSFLLLFIQFGFVIGLYFYLVAQHRGVPETKEGFIFFVTISIGVILLYLMKILILKFVGFVFNIKKPVHQYISILYLSYFNASLLFFPVVIAFALSPVKYGSWYVYLGFLTLLVIFVFQFTRAVVNVLSQYSFPKLYLFLYLCTLEICPILILIKAIDF